MTASALLASLHAHRRAIVARDARTEQRLAALYRAGVQRPVAHEVEQLTAAMTAWREAHSTADTPTPTTWLYGEGAERMHRLQTLVSGHADDYADAASRLIDQDASDAERSGERDGLALLNTTTPRHVRHTFGRPNPHALSALAHHRQLRRHLFAHWGQRAGNAILRLLVADVALGRNPRAIGYDLVRLLGSLTYSRAVTIARTSALRAYNDASLATYRANSDVVQGWVWVADLSVNTCGACLALNGTVHDLAEDLDGHPNCLVAGTVVAAAGVRASTTRWFRGEVVEIITAAGRHVTVTENHPILTSEGWVAAGLLRKGGYVIGCRDVERVVRATDPHDYQVPALIEDVAATLGKPGSVIARRVPVTPKDFHGDGSGSEVCVVRTNGLLQDAFYSALTEPALQDSLCLGHMVLSRLIRLGTLQHRAERPLASTDGRLRVEDALFARVGRSLSHAETVGVRHAPLRDASLTHAQVNDTSADAVAGCERIDRLTGLIAPDKIIHVNRMPYEGHVYNLQTSEGWYTANSIVTHNCRCAKAPLTRGWDEILGDLGLGIDTSGIPDTRAAFTPGADWFDALSAGEQRDVLGPGKYAAFSAGDFSLDDLIGYLDDPLWGRSIYELPLRRLQKGA